MTKASEAKEAAEKAAEEAKTAESAIENTVEEAKNAEPADDNKVEEVPATRLTTLTAPVSAFNGSIGGVRFTNGVATTDNIAVIGYCQGAGYTVEPAN